MRGEIAVNILVAEDEKDIRGLIRIALEEKGYTLYEAKDGREALEILEREAIDMAILDVIMPRLDGFNLIREIRKVSHMPVMFLTARGEEMDRVLGLGLGADDYLIKPFSLAELIARVEAVLRRTNTYNRVKIEAEIEGDRAYKTGNVNLSEKVIVCRALKMDVKSCLLYKGDKNVELNPKEYKLLKFLMENPNTVFTKKKLYEKVWEGEYSGDSRTLDLHVQRLRRKLGWENSLVAVYKVGYRLEVPG